MCTVLLPPGDNPIAVNKCINIKVIGIFHLLNPSDRTMALESSIRIEYLQDFDVNISYLLS